MASIFERRAAEDRISNLPINLITHILSFLSTKDAVRTSALSTYWVQLWTLTTHLDFDDGIEIGYSYPSRVDNFVNFVYRVLLSKVTPLDLFRLRGGDEYDTTNVRQWLSTALSRGARNVDVDVRMPRSCLIPSNLLSSKTLVVLKLSGRFVLGVPEMICLESLKICHFQSVEFEDDKSFSKLVSSSLVLEELKIVGKLSKRVNVLNISLLVLKRLILGQLYSQRCLENENGAPHLYEVVLNTPSLQYLEHRENCGLPDGYHTKTLHYLDTARIDLRQCSNQAEDYGDELIPVRSIAELILAISNVRFLYLIGDAFEAPNKLPNFELPKFPRLTYLEIDAIVYEDEVQLLTDFLRSSPQLAYLSLKIVPEDVLSYPLTDVPFCMLYNLEVIEVEYWDELEPILSLLAYFLEKTKCLKEFIIREPKEKNEEFITKLCMLPRASKSCKIVFT